jgi:hypothetical protein
MRSTQRGATFLGLMILIAFVGLFVYGGIRLVPVYVEYMDVAKALDGLKSSGADASSLSQQTIRTALQKRFEVDDVKSLDWRDIEITREGDSWKVHAAYDATAPFVGNVDLVVHFDKTVSLGGAGGV